jgi:uncharacterized protein DUF6962
LIVMFLAEPAMAITDLVLGSVALALAQRLRGRAGVTRFWTRTFEWTGIAALSGALHHGLLPLDSGWRDPTFAVICGMVVIAVSYMLAATVDDVLGPGQWRAFWVLRSASLVAYGIVALLGHAGIEAILFCEAVTMVAILALWGLAARRRHPRAPHVIAAIVALAGASVLQGTPSGIGAIDSTSMYHLGQTLALMVLYWAVAVPAGAGRRPAVAPVRDSASSSVQRTR